jgi:DNA invertase Pin-like site-specific DNA recombinase
MLQPRDLKGRRAISYARWSSGKQAAGDSLRRQIDNAIKFCASHGLTLDDNIVDDGVSAFKGKNLDLEASLGQFIRKVKAGAISSDTVLILEDLDRFSRTKPMDVLPKFIDLLNTGLTLVTLRDARVHSRESYDGNAMNLIASVMGMQAAYDYSAKISYRVGDEWSKRPEKARQGKVRISKVPFWIDQQTQELNHRADDARLIFRLASEGMGQNGITQHLNLTGIPSSRGGQWGKSMVQDVIKSKAAYGSLVIKGEEVREYYPALITETDWLAIQHRTRMRRHNPQVGNAATLFPRLMYCAHCGSVMNLSTSRFGKFRYLICQGKTTKRTTCSAPNWRYENLERAFLDRVGFLAVPVPNDSPREEATAALVDAVRELHARRENILAGIAGAYDAASRDFLLQQSRTLTEQIERKREMIVEAREREARATTVASAVVNFAEDIERIHELAKEDRKGVQRLISDLVERIELESASKELRRANITLRGGYAHSIVFDEGAR